MVDMNISELEYRAKVSLSKRELGDVVLECERTIRNRQRFDKSNGFDLDFVNAFLGLYHSIEDKLKDSRYGLNPNNNGNARMLKLYSFYSSSKAILNSLLDDELEVAGRTQGPRVTSLKLSDLRDNKSSKSILTALFQRLTYDVKNYTAMPVKQNIFNFFESLKNASVRELLTSYSRKQIDDLAKIKISKEGFDFSEIILKKKESGNNGNGRQKSESKLADYLPKEVPKYILDSEARIEDVVGNENALKELMNAGVQLLCHDAEKGINPFYTGGCSFHDAFIIFGDPGVGKTFTVNSFYNKIQELAEYYGIDLVFGDLGAIRSIYKDASAQMLANIASIERKNKNIIYINTLDEANSVITVGPDGKTSEESKKVIGEVKKGFGDRRGEGHVLTILITNYTSDDEIEPAIKRRFKPLHMEGPQNPDDFGRMLYNQLKPKVDGGLTDGEINWQSLGQRICEYKTMGVKAVGSDVEMLCRPLKNATKKPFYQMSHIIGMNYEQHEQLKQNLFTKLTYDTIRQAIDNHFMEKIKQDGYKMQMASLEPPR